MEIKDIISSGLLELYVTGLTSQSETVEVEQWADQFHEVKDELSALQLVMEEYAYSQAIQPELSIKQKIFSQLQPDHSIKQKVFSRIEEATPQNKIAQPLNTTKDAVVYQMSSSYKWLAAASVVLLLVSLITNYIFYNKYQSSTVQYQAFNKQYDSIVNIHQSDSNALLVAHQQIQQQKNITNPDQNSQINQSEGISAYANIAGNKYAMPVVLKGTNHAPEALAKIYWMKNSGEVYVDATYLPQAPEGKQYQLWAIVNGQPVDAGMINTPKAIYKIQKMKSFGKVEVFAITLEKSGGSPTPTMDEMVVKAKI